MDAWEAAEKNLGFSSIWFYEKYAERLKEISSFYSEVLKNNDLRHVNR